MGDFGDGRLELDELGAVLDHAASLDPSPGEDVVAGNERPTFGDRLESSGVAPWARRHARALVVATAVAVSIGVLGVGWKQSQPPPLDPTIAGSVADAMADGTAPVVSGTIYDGQLVVALRVEDGNDRDTISVLGIAGPGIRASTAVPVTTVPVPGVVDVFVVPGCDDPRALRSTTDDYRLRVQRTDAYGRVTTGLLPLPSAVAAQLVDTSAQHCLDARVTESVTVTDVNLRPDVARRMVHADITLHNGLDLGLRVDGVSGTTDGTEPSVEQADLPAGGSAVQHVTIGLNDCGAQGTLVRRPDGTAFDDLNFYVTPSSGGPISSGMSLSWTTAQRATIAAAERQMCTRAPGATASVLSAAPAPAPASTVYGFATPQDGVVLRARVEIRTHGTHLVLSDGSYPLTAYVAGGPPTVATVTTDVARGRVLVDVDWAAQCSSVVGPPPVWLVVTAGGTTYPYRALLDSPVLARAYAAACPAAVPSDLGQFGWATG